MENNTKVKQKRNVSLDDSNICLRSLFAETYHKSSSRVSECIRASTRIRRLKQNERLIFFFFFWRMRRPQQKKKNEDGRVMDAAEAQSTVEALMPACRSWPHGVYDFLIQSKHHGGPFWCLTEIFKFIWISISVVTCVATVARSLSVFILHLNHATEFF